MSREQLQLIIMERFPTCLFLILSLCSGCESIETFDVVPDGTIWLGESLTLKVNMPKIMRPIVWKSGYHKYECDSFCADGPNYKVTHTENTSTLWIGNVSWEFSTWVVYDYNLQMGKIDLDINVKPKIEIKNTSKEYQLIAGCSAPLTKIECFQGKKTLKFTNATQSICSKGKTLSNIRTLSFSEFCGNVTCRFSIGNIFRERRWLHFEIEHASSRNITTDSLLLFASIALFILDIIVGYFLFKKLTRKMRTLQRPNGEDVSPINLTTEFVLRFAFCALIFAMNTPVAFGCKMRKETKTLKCEDSHPLICIIEISSWVISVLLSIAWVIAAYRLSKMGKQLQILKSKNGEDSPQRNRITAIVFPLVLLPEFILLFLACISRCSKCENGEDPRQRIPTNTNLLPQLIFPEFILLSVACISRCSKCENGVKCFPCIMIIVLCVFLLLNITWIIFLYYRLKKRNQSQNREKESGIELQEAEYISLFNPGNEKALQEPELISVSEKRQGVHRRGLNPFQHHIKRIGTKHRRLSPFRYQMKFGVFWSQAHPRNVVKRKKSLSKHLKNGSGKSTYFKSSKFRKGNIQN